MRRIILTFFAVAGLLWLTACNSSHATERQPVAPVVHGVALITAERASVPDALEGVGNVRAAQSATVASQAMGYVLSVHAVEGDRVHRGQLLALIDDAQPKAAVQRAQAGVIAADQETVAAETEYTLAHTTLKRYEQLAARDVISAHDFDEIKARADAAAAHRDFARAGQAQARAALAEAQTTLAHTRVVAPFDGIVTEKKIDPGALAAPGSPLFTMDASGRYRLEASVDESSLHFVRERQSVPVILDALGPRAVAGTVALIVPAADAASRSFVVKVDLPADPGIRSGLFGRAQFSKGNKEALLVPADAVVERGQMRGVYVIGEDRIAQLRLVTIGRTVDGRVEILSGLTPGERLAAAPGTNDLGGKQVEVSDAAQTRR
jgi:membrane fusion protein, multidrug efflux system